MDYFDLMLIPLLAMAAYLLAALLSGICLFFPWLASLKDAGPHPKWPRAWGGGWMLFVTAVMWAGLNYYAPWEGMAAQMGTVAGLMILFSAFLWTTALLMFWQAKPLLLIGWLSFPVICLISLTFLHYKYVTPPADQNMIANFYRHKADFNQLVQMSQADRSLGCVGDGCLQPDDPPTAGVAAKKVTEYRRLLDRVQVGRGFQYSSEPQDFQFFYWGHGSAVSSDTDKGYAYLAVPPAQVFASLDDCQPDQEKGSLFYRHIEGHWYLYYDYLPG